MKHRVSTDKLIAEMAEFIAAVRESERGTTYNESVIVLKTGDVLAALEVFTFANFTEDEQEVIFARARKSMEDSEPPTGR